MRLRRARAVWSAALVGTFLVATLALIGAAPAGAKLLSTGQNRSSSGAQIATTTPMLTTSGQPGCSATGVGSPTASAGYWLAGADGSVYSCGDAPWNGSLTSLHITPDGPVVGIAGCGSGYWLTTSAGAVYAFGGVPPWAALTTCN
jgi:hypothetical protein